MDAADIRKVNVLNRLGISECSQFAFMSPMSATKDTHYRRD